MPASPVLRSFANQTFARPRPEWVRIVLEVSGLGLLALFLWGFVERNAIFQGDLKTYQFAARAALDGHDPYRHEVLNAIAGRNISPFVYPPVALVPFLTISGLPPAVVAFGWMWVKIGLLGALTLLWAGMLRQETGLLAVALVALFGWNSSALWDLAAGNVAIVECALVWGGLACFVAGRRTAFALLIAAAACFKLAPAAFLLLLLVPTDRAPAGPWRLALGLAALGVLVLGPAVVGPAASFRPFWDGIPDATEFGPANPSMLGLVMTLLRLVGLTGPHAMRIANIAWLAYAVALVACSLPLLRDSWRARDARQWAMLAVFLYLLLHPRPMAYGFVLLTPAPLYFSPRPFDHPVGRLLLSVMLAAQGMLRLTSNTSFSPLVVYAPILLSLCVWLLVVNEGAAKRAQCPIAV